MANHKSSVKRARQENVRTLQNKSRLSMTRTALKKVRKAIGSQDKKAANELLPNAQSLLAKLAKRGIIKQNTAARKSSRLSNQVNSI